MKDSRDYPANISRGNPVKVSRENPVNLSRELPVNVSRENPVNVSRENPGNISRKNPVNVSQIKNKINKNIPDFTSITIFNKRILLVKIVIEVKSSIFVFIINVGQFPQSCA